jgi:hypothetical protein
MVRWWSAQTIPTVARPIIYISLFLFVSLSLSLSLSLSPSAVGSRCCLTSFGCHTNQRLREKHAIMGRAKLFPSFFRRVIVFHDLFYFFAILRRFSWISFFLRLGVFTNPLLTLVFYKSPNVSAHAAVRCGGGWVLLLTCRPRAAYAIF